MRALLTILAFAVFLAPPVPARAYPQFQLSMGASRCNECHVSPAGGGLLRGYGRFEAGATISRGGDGAFLHGAVDLPGWVSLGGDLRFVSMVNDVDDADDPDLLVFPMQGDLYSAFHLSDFTAVVTIGGRGQTRDEDAPLTSRLVSREHYLLWQPDAVGPYARAGRFFPIHGLRLVEHPAYVRRFLGLGLLEETYGVGGGWIEDGWELHATAYRRAFFRPVGDRDNGFAVYGEKRLFDARAAVGGQARLGLGPEKDRLLVGGLGKLWLEGPKILFMTELDLVNESFDDVPGAGRLQVAGWLGASWFPFQGLVVTPFVERWDPDLSTDGVARTALGGELQFFPWAHVEVVVYGRHQFFGWHDSGDPSTLAMLQLHYYL